MLETTELLISSERSATTKEIKKAIFNFQSKGLVVTKGAENTHFKSKYADLADVMRTIQPGLTDTGLLIMHFTEGDNKIITEITHVESEEFFKNTYNLNAISKTPQAIGSALTYSKRYAIVAMLNITVDGDDDDGNAGTQPEAKGVKKANENNLKELSPESKKDWQNAILAIQNKKFTIEDVLRSYSINEIDKAILIKESKKAKKSLKPGTTEWLECIKSLAASDDRENKLKALEWRFTITEANLQDLQLDANDYILNPEQYTNSQTTNTTK